MHVTTVEDLASIARERRQGLGLSQQQLADKVGVSRLWINEFEGGKPKVELHLVLRVFRELDLFLQVAVRKEGVEKGEVSKGIDLDELLGQDER